jgi:O-antigen ligase
MTGIRYLLPTVIAVRLLAHYKATLRVLQSAPFLCGFHVIVFASYGWSVSPPLTLEFLRSQYIQGILIALFLATRFTILQQLRFTVTALSLAAISSIFYVFAFPNRGVHSDILHAGAWRGIFHHKNYFSSVMILGAAGCLVQIIDPRQRRPWNFLAFVLFMLLTILSTSKTGQLVLVTVLLAIFLYRRYRWRGMTTVLFLYLALMATVFGIIVLMTAWDQIFIGIGRDPTLTGRTLIWDALRDVFVPQRPLLGYGYGAFWHTNVWIGYFYNTIGFLPANAHNGWYDLIIDVGYVGLFFYVASALRAWYRVLRLAYLRSSVACTWPLAFFTIVFLNNYTESLILYQTSIFWVLYMALCWSLKEALVTEAAYDGSGEEDPIAS